MSKQSERIVVYGASWCPDARRARRLLDERTVDYSWIDVDEDNNARNFIKKTNGGKFIIPVIVFPDESILVEPANEELSEKLEALFGNQQPES